MQNKTKWITMGLSLALVLGLGVLPAMANEDAEVTKETNLGMAMQIDDKVSYSMDGGETWLDPEAFEAAYPTPQVEWWDADELRAHMQEQRDVLDELVRNKAEGVEKDGTPFIWDEARADEVMRVYEDMLKRIEAGAKISKTVNGRDDLVFEQFGDAEFALEGSLTDAYGNLHTFKADTSDDLARQMRGHCNEQVAQGKMTQQEADRIMRQYN